MSAGLIESVPCLIGHQPVESGDSKRGYGTDVGANGRGSRAAAAIGDLERGDRHACSVRGNSGLQDDWLHGLPRACGSREVTMHTARPSRVATGPVEEGLIEAAHRRDARHACRQRHIQGNGARRASDVGKCDEVVLGRSRRDANSDRRRGVQRPRCGASRAPMPIVESMRVAATAIPVRVKSLTTFIASAPWSGSCCCLSLRHALPRRAYVHVPSCTCAWPWDAWPGDDRRCPA